MKDLEKIFEQFEKLSEDFDFYRENFKKSFINYLKQNYEVLKKQINLEKLFKFLEKEKFIFYGAGFLTSFLLDELIKRCIYPKAIFDIKVERISNFPVVKYPDEVTHEYIRFSVVITLMSLEKIGYVKESLKKLGFKKIYTIFDFFNKKEREIIIKSSFYYEILKKFEKENFGQSAYWFLENYFKSPNFYKEHKEKIFKVYQLLLDEKSKKIFLDFFKHILLLDFEEITYWEDPNVQYFPKDIHFAKGYDVFIDGGAYAGDTLSGLYKNIGKVNKVICFEPDIKIFNVLKKYVEKYKNNIANEIILLPVGLGKKEELLSFTTQVPGGAHMTDLGNEYIFTCSLDNVLCGVKPTFIKMDIEGAELDALKGAENLIKEHKPDLAICVYHEPSHFWDIPLFLHQLVPEYKFYLRKYNPFLFLKTGFYATI